MYFGVDYHPEQWVYPYGGTKENPESAWARDAELMGKAGINVVLATPTAAPPIWLSRKHPEILPVDERGLIKHEGTRRAVCLNSDVFWNYSKRIVENMAKTLGKHPQLIAWQIDNGLGGHFTEASFIECSRQHWDLYSFPTRRPLFALSI